MALVAAALAVYGGWVAVRFVRERSVEARLAKIDPIVRRHAARTCVLAID